MVWGATFLPFAFLLFMVARCGFDVPYWDSWRMVSMLEKTYDGTLTFQDVWGQHNEHRMFVPWMIMLGLARLTGWNHAAEWGVTVGCAALSFALIAHPMPCNSQKYLAQG